MQNVLSKIKERSPYVISEVKYDLTKSVAARYWGCTVSRQSNVAVGAGFKGGLLSLYGQLYGLKSRRSHWCNAIINVLVYKASKFDSDVLWKKEREVRDNERGHYSYFVIYFDNILRMHVSPKVKWRNWDQDNALRVEVMKSLKNALDDIRSWMI